MLSKEDIKTLHAFLIPTITVQASKEQDELEELLKEDIEYRDPVFSDIYAILTEQTERLFEQFKKKEPTHFHMIGKIVYPFIEYGINHNSTIFFDFPKWMKSDKYPCHHAVLVSLFVGLIAHKAGMEKKQILEASIAGYLHNIGQLLISEDIFNKPGALSEKELAEVQKHTIYGYELLKEIPGMPDSIADAVLHHHEREDGSGYPAGLKTPEIHPYAKLIAIADIYIAMCSEKLYRPGHSPIKTIEHIKNDSFGRLDRAFVQYFLKLVLDKLDIGKQVILNNGWSGEIVFVDQNAVTQPIVKCGEQIINLQLEKDLYIEGVK